MALAEGLVQDQRAWQNGVELSAFPCCTGDTLRAMNDIKLPTSSSEGSISRQSFRDLRGTAKWAWIDVAEERKPTRARVH